MLVLDSGAVSRLAERSRESIALISALDDHGLWPPLVPSVVLVECLTGVGPRDAAANRLLKLCDVVEGLPVGLARRAARLRAQAARGSAVDAVLVAVAEPGGVVLTSDPHDLRRLAAQVADVAVDTI